MPVRVHGQWRGGANQRRLQGANLTACVMRPVLLNCCAATPSVALRLDSMIIMDIMVCCCDAFTTVRPLRPRSVLRLAMYPAPTRIQLRRVGISAHGLRT